MSECEQLDDYLDGELLPEQVEAFRRHVRSCGECSSAIRAHQEFMRLVEKAKQRLDRSVTDVPRPVRLGIRSFQLKRRIGFVVGVAASILFCVLALNWVRTGREKSQHPIALERAATTPDIGHASPGPNGETADVAVSVADSHYLAVPMKTTTQDVTILWLHPTHEPDNSDDSSGLLLLSEPLLAGRI